jgi:hypothetical protein
MTDPTDLSPEALDAAEALALNIIGGTFIAGAITGLRARLAEAEREWERDRRQLLEAQLALIIRAERAEAAVERAVGLALERAADMVEREGHSLHVAIRYVDRAAISAEAKGEAT